MKLVKYFILLLTVSSFNAFGQINKGTFLLGGTVRFEKNDASENDLRYSPSNQINLKKFTFGPRGAYFLRTNLALGLLVNYEHSETRGLDVEQGLIMNGQTQTLAVGPFVRYYHFARPELAFFGQASASYSHNYNAQDYYGLTANLAPGLTYFISSKVGLEMIIGGLSYNHAGYKLNEDNKSTSSLIDVRFLNGAQIGVSFYLSR